MKTFAFVTPAVAYLASAGPCRSSLPTTRWKTGPPKSGDCESVRDTRVADGEIITNPPAL